MLVVVGLAWRARAGELEKIVLDYDTAVDAALQAKVEGLDGRLRRSMG